MSFKLRTYTEPNFKADSLLNAPDATVKAVLKDGVAPENYHATTIFPEYFKVGGTWLLAEESRMDCVAVLKGSKVDTVEFRSLKKGDLVFVGRTEKGEEGIFVHAKGFSEDTQEEEVFAFRKGRSRETSFSMDYDSLYELLRHEREKGNILWVLGPACSFDSDSRRALELLISNGYVNGVLAGNALAAHDLEGAYRKTALGQDIYTQRSQAGGHYNHIDTINKVREYGSIPEFIKGEGIDNGIMYGLVKNSVPFVLVGSIRDDGPLPEVYGNVYEGQNAMRDCVRKATTVICLATALHSIATGNMTPSFRVLPDGTVRQVYFYCVDVSEFPVNKLADRGSLCAKGIVTNVQDFVVNVAKGLGVLH